MRLPRCFRAAFAAFASLVATSCATTADTGRPDIGKQPADRYFPANYEASRDAFRSACSAAATAWNATCTSYPVSYPDLHDPADADLTIDIAYVTRGNPRLVILQSGLHGVEAFAGAAIEQLVFERHMKALLVSGFDVLMIHAANPWGFKHLRRVDGGNVDLNRNFAPDSKPDFYKRENPAYEALRGIAEPESPVGDIGGESTSQAARRCWPTRCTVSISVSLATGRTAASGGTRTVLNTAATGPRSKPGCSARPSRRSCGGTLGTFCSWTSTRASAPPTR
jgi:hypothetical protein